MKTITLITILAFAAAGSLQARQPEGMRQSSEDISINTTSLQDNAATSQFDIQPTPVTNGLAELIAKLIKIIFNLDGDVEITSPAGEVPQVDGNLDDDQQQEETYVEGRTYDPIEDSSLPRRPFQPQPRQSQQSQQPQQPQEPVFNLFQAPQQQDGPRADISAQGGAIPADLKRKAMEYFSANQGRIQNKKYIGVVDFAAHSSKTRFWIIDMQTGVEHGMHVAHGSGSDPDGDGYATRFSNTPNSKASSLGFYLTGALYNGAHGKSMRLHGLSQTNSNVLSRAVVIHESNYVREANVRQGRSFGCLAVATNEIGNVLASLRGGALIYAGLSNSEF